MADEQALEFLFDRVGHFGAKAVIIEQPEFDLAEGSFDFPPLMVGIGEFFCGGVVRVQCWRPEPEYFGCFVCAAMSAHMVFDDSHLDMKKYVKVPGFVNKAGRNGPEQAHTSGWRHASGFASGWLRIIAARTARHTSSSCWLSPWCSKVTIPIPGRDRDRRLSVTSVTT